MDLDLHCFLAGKKKVWKRHQSTSDREGHREPFMELTFVKRSGGIANCQLLQARVYGPRTEFPSSKHDQLMSITLDGGM